ncbi:MAG: hypothetical protein KatS3mg011_0408 [Acidimicrobiia bacterium]|nr:MAG: hypothetical protein KatS3mg011_0408 [Acidimicrobiia bacterium]
MLSSRVDALHKALLTRVLAGRYRRPLIWLGLVALPPVAALLGALVDVPLLTAALESAAGDPLGVGAALVGFGAAFLLRAAAWRAVVPDLPLGQAWAGLHVALAANHVLPLRMGEPLRVVSAVRRSKVGWQEAASSTVLLRAVDVATLAIIGMALGVGVGPGVLVLALGVAAVAGWWMRSRAHLDVPWVAMLGFSGLAWLAEAVVIHESVGWTGWEVSWAGALGVTAGAVIAQLAAVTPAGIGTYEAGAVAALAVLGVPPGPGLVAALAAHGLKTVYSLVVGLVGLAWPPPAMWGRLRLPAGLPPREPEPPGDGPVVLFLPAHDEEATVADVVSRTPRRVRGREVRVMVVDDGSADHTAELAAAAGAEVVRLPENQGLGAAVRHGLREALLRHDPSVVAFCDADGEYAPEELERLAAPILDGEADYVVGTRFGGEIDRMLPHRRLGNRVLTALLRWVSRCPLTDGQSGYRALSATAARAARIAHDFNYAQVLTLDLLAKGFRYREVPISYSFRRHGRSFVRPVRYLLRVAPTVWRMLNPGQSSTT